MTITSPLLLPADVILTPVAELPEHLQEQMEYADGDYAISRPRSRAPSRIIDSQAAALLQEFRTAKTIVQAVISYSRATKTDPEEALEAAFPMIKRFLDSRLLVLADSHAAGQIVDTFAIGDRFDKFTVLSCLKVLEDTELYQVKQASGQEAVLKIARPGAGPDLERMFERETAILKHLDGSVNARLIEEGMFEDRLYLAIAWCPGVYVTAVAEELRQLPSRDGRKKLLELCCAILEAYARLHTQNVIHSDVHPQNMLIAADGSITIIDYGLARLADAKGDIGIAHRGGVGFYFEPECAKALRAGKQPPQSSFLAEQYALAAMLYFLFTGAHYLEFSLEKSEMLRQIAEDPVLPFPKGSLGPCPDVEKLLARALSKEPSDRFPSVSEFARRLREVAVHTEEGDPLEVRSAPQVDSSAAEMLLNDVLQRVQISGPLFSSGLMTPPTCSVNYGAAGIAYALYRIASVRSDATLLALADVWANRAMRDIGNSSAFFSRELDITTQTVGRISPNHCPSGVHCVQAFICHAMGDIGSRQEAINAFMLASKAPCEDLDITLGKSSSLLACSLLLDTVPDYDELRNFGNAMMSGIWDQVNTFAPIRECREISYLGIAHGWAGILYATMRWCQASGIAPPRPVAERLQQLAEFAEHKGRGVRWKLDGSRGSKGVDEYMSGWCHGSAGYVHLWTLAHHAFQDERHLALAEKAAWNAWEEPETSGSLCCGLAGRAYGLLNLYKYSGERDWLPRAHQLANKGAVRIKNWDLPIDSLYKGEIGVAVLSADLSKPESSCMPFFEAEGWPCTSDT